MIPSIIISVSYLVSQSLAPYLHFIKHIIEDVIKTVNSNKLLIHVYNTPEKMPISHRKIYDICINMAMITVILSQGFEWLIKNNSFFDNVFFKRNVLII